MALHSIQVTTPSILGFSQDRLQQIKLEVATYISQ